MAVIGGLARIEGAWVGALAFILIGNYVRDSWLTELLDDVHIGGSFNTIIGLIFLLIVIVSPDGLVGLWDRLWGRIQRGGDSDVPGRRRTRRRRSAGSVKREEEWSNLVIDRSSYQRRVNFHQGGQQA